MLSYRDSPDKSAAERGFGAAMTIVPGSCAVRIITVCMSPRVDSGIQVQSMPMARFVWDDVSGCVRGLKELSVQSDNVSDLLIPRQELS